MVGWHHRLSGQESEQALGDSGGQCGGSLSNENENEVRTFLKPYTKINF